MQVDEENHYASFNIKTVTETTNNASGIIPENPDMKLASCLKLPSAKSGETLLLQDRTSEIV